MVKRLKEAGELVITLPAIVRFAYEDGAVDLGVFDYTYPIWGHVKEAKSVTEEGWFIAGA